MLMDSKTNPKVLIITDKGDWITAVVFSLFLVAFPIAIWAVWHQPRDLAPLYFVVPFTLFFLLTVPFLLRAVFGARTNRFSFNYKTKKFKLMRKGLFFQETIEEPLAAINRLILVTSDNDGYYYKLLLELSDGQRLKLAQGSWEPSIREIAEVHQDWLNKAGYSVPIIEEAS